MRVSERTGRCIDALKKRRRVLKKRGRVHKKRGRVLNKVGLVRGTGGWPLLQKGEGRLLKKGGVLKNPSEVLKEFDPLPSTLAVSPGVGGCSPVPKFLPRVFPCSPALAKESYDF